MAFSTIVCVLKGPHEKPNGLEMCYGAKQGKGTSVHPLIKRSSHKGFATISFGYFWLTIMPLEKGNETIDNWNHIVMCMEKKKLEKVI